MQALRQADAREQEMGRASLVNQIADKVTECLVFPYFVHGDLGNATHPEGLGPFASGGPLHKQVCLHLCACLARTLPQTSVS